MADENVHAALGYAECFHFAQLQREERNNGILQGLNADPLTAEGSGGVEIGGQDDVGPGIGGGIGTVRELIGLPDHRPGLAVVVAEDADAEVGEAIGATDVLAGPEHEAAQADGGAEIDGVGKAGCRGFDAVDCGGATPVDQALGILGSEKGLVGGGDLAEGAIDFGGGNVGVDFQFGHLKGIVLGRIVEGLQFDPLPLLRCGKGDFNNDSRTRARVAAVAEQSLSPELGARGARGVCMDGDPDIAEPIRATAILPRKDPEVGDQTALAQIHRVTQGGTVIGVGVESTVSVLVDEPEDRVVAEERPIRVGNAFTRDIDDLRAGRTGPGERCQGQQPSQEGYLFYGV